MCLIILALAHFAPLDLCSAQNLPAPPPPLDAATVERPDFNVKIPRVNAPPPGDYDITADSQEAENGVYHLHGHVVVELSNATFKADEAEYDESTNIFKAHGNVTYRNYDRNEVINCDSAEYNTDTARGTFHRVRGYMKAKIQSRPGQLTTQEPFYFEAMYAEKFENRYLLHDGIITDCHVPDPWWTIHSSLFDITPGERAVTHNATFRLRKIPLFYFPYFYRGLQKEPRKSGFLTPNVGHSSQFGYLVGLGYYWAISRSFDTQYLFTDYTARGYAHHVDFRGKPTQKTNLNFIFYGVNDRGVVQNGVVNKASGISLTGSAKTEFAEGWVARGTIDYLSSLKFRQTFSNSFNEAIYSASTSTGFVSKDFGAYSFHTEASRTENFQDTTPGNSVIIRKLPEFEFDGRDRAVSTGSLPLWFSFDSSFGLYHRAEPRPLAGFYETSQFSSRADFEPSITTRFHWGGFSVAPSFTLHETFYGQSLLNGTVSSTNTVRNAPELGVDIVFPTIERVFDARSFLGDKLKHVVEPRVQYKYITGVDSYNSTLRFDAMDLLSNTSEIQVGITNRLYAKRGDSVTEVLTWELYQKYFFDPSFGGAVVAGQRNVVLSAMDLTGYSFLSGLRDYSPVVSVLRTAPRPGIGLQWEADYDPLRHGIVNSMFSADIRIRKYFVSAGHNQVRPDPVLAPPANQVRATLGYGDPNHKGWNGAFSTVYDYRRGFVQYAIGQVTYNTDCCGLSVEFRRLSGVGTRNDNQYRLAFTIANIGTFGNLKKQERLF